MLAVCVEGLDLTFYAVAAERQRYKAVLTCFHEAVAVYN